MRVTLQLLISVAFGFITVQAHQKNFDPLHHPTQVCGVDYLQTSIREIQTLLQNGTITSVQLVQDYLNRIERDNHDGMRLRAVIQSAPRDSVLKIASDLDEERSRGQLRGELHGIPILVKDNIATDSELGMGTTTGSLAFVNSVVKGDAFVVDRLRKAGAIVIAKTNLNELAGWKGVLKAFNPISQDPTLTPAAPTELMGNVTFRAPTNGWSAVGGQCKSAYVEGEFEDGADPMGSSSGSAVGLSVGWGAGALGTDTLGSALAPANRAALYSVRPTLGRLSRSGLVPVSLDHDTVGPMGFSTYDVALMLELMSGEDIDDSSTHGIPPLQNLTEIALNQPDISSFSIGVPTRYFLNDPIFELPSGCPSESRAKFVETIYNLENHHYVNVTWNTNINLTSHADISKFLEVLTDKIDIEFKADMEDYLKGLKESKVRSMLDLAMFNDRYSSEELPPHECCQERILSSLISPPRESAQHRKLTPLNEYYADDQSIGYIFKQNPHLDVIASSFELGAPSYWVGAANYPAGVVPLGYCSNGLPHGMMFVARKFHEEKLIGIMAAYEKNMPKRKVPKPYYDRYKK